MLRRIFIIVLVFQLGWWSNFIWTYHYLDDWVKTNLPKVCWSKELKGN